MAAIVRHEEDFLVEYGVYWYRYTLHYKVDTGAFLNPEPA